MTPNLDLIALGAPASAQLLVFDSDSGESQVLAEYDGFQPVATWSADSNWIVTFEPDAVRLSDAEDLGRDIRLENVIPEGFRPLAAG